MKKLLITLLSTAFILPICAMYNNPYQNRQPSWINQLGRDAANTAVDSAIRAAIQIAKMKAAQKEAAKEAVQQAQ